jgi:1-acyl-sn-glycerol-3-phosphate acyltransferase
MELFFYLLYFIFFINYSTYLLFIPSLILYNYFPKHQYILHILKNLFWSSSSFFSTNVMFPKIYINDINMFENIFKNKQQNIIISNHLTELDFIVLAILLNNKKVFSAKICGIVKKSVGFMIFFVGFIGFMTGDIFLNRKIELDMYKLKNKITCDLIALFPEGTCFNKDRKKISDQYCAKNNLPVFKYHLYPRITGIKTIIQNNHNFKNIYDFTIVYENIDKKKYGTHYNIFYYLFSNNNLPKKIYINISKYNLEQNNSKDYIDKKIENIYYNKDKFVKKFDIHNNKFYLFNYNNTNGFISFLIINLISLFSIYLFYNYRFVRYLYLLEFIFFYLYFYFYV